MRLAVVGTGLIGGSFALAARARGIATHITGVDADPGRASEALARGIVDELAEMPPGDVDVVLLAVPSDRVAPWVAALADHPGIVFDAASVKESVIEAVRSTLGRVPPRFVPAHPIAGRETSGPGAADAGLFESHQVVLTPVPETDARALTAVTQLWEGVGARVSVMSAAAHDEMLAVTSHLPHLVAFAYLQTVTPEHMRHAAGGFRDFSRIAASDPAMWAPIFTQNGRAVLAALDDLEQELNRLRALIAAGKREDLVQLIEESRRRRRAFGKPSVNEAVAVSPAPVIAIDGPSGSGKGTVAAAVAERLGWRLLDSGALYRVVADAALRRGVALDDAAALALLATDIEIRFAGEAVMVDGVDRALAIRTEDVSAAASKVAALEPVRAAMLDLQRAQRLFPGLVADGRDMGTVVFPDAALKVFLDASLEARAERRYIQLKNKGLAVSVSDLLATLEERDRRDRGRAVAPLRPAEDAVLIDSTALTVDAVVARVLEAARVRGIVTRT